MIAAYSRQDRMLGCITAAAAQTVTRRIQTQGAAYLKVFPIDPQTGKPLCKEQRSQL